MMYRTLRQANKIPDEEIRRISERRQRAAEPKNGGLTVAQFFLAMSRITDENAVAGTLEIQTQKGEAAK